MVPTKTTDNLVARSQADVTAAEATLLRRTRKNVVRQTTVYLEMNESYLYNTA
jgi:hypothetical protein